MKVCRFETQTVLSVVAHGYGLIIGVLISINLDRAAMASCHIFAGNSCLSISNL